jgi:hypothetical protein
MKVTKAFKNWWNGTSKDQRILDEITDEWRSGLDIIIDARVSVGTFYSRTPILEANGIIESKWEAGPGLAVRGYRRRRLYRKAPDHALRGQSQ